MEVKRPAKPPCPAPPPPGQRGGRVHGRLAAVPPTQEQCRQVGTPGGVPGSRDVNHARGATGDRVKRKLKHRIQNHPPTGPAQTSGERHGRL